MDKNNIKHKVNDKITHTEIRVVGKGVESQVLPIDEALKLADDMGVDLIEVVSNAKPPVCKLIDMDKYLYGIKQKEKEKVKNQRKSSIKMKEIRLSYNMGEHDFNFKLKHAINFLEKNNKVKLSMFFRGRQIQFKDQGEYQMVKFIDQISDHGKIENLPKLDNRRLWAIVAPKNN